MDDTTRKATAIGVAVAGLGFLIQMSDPNASYRPLLWLSIIVVIASASGMYFWPQLRSLMARKPTVGSGGQETDDTLRSTAIVHGGKLRLSLTDAPPTEIIQQISSSISHIGCLISVTNEDFHQTVDNVTASIVSIVGETEDKTLTTLLIELASASGRVSIDPQSRLYFRLGVAERFVQDDGTEEFQRFWLGREGAYELDRGTYIISIAYSGRNHSERVERAKLRFTASSIEIVPEVTKAIRGS